MGSRVMYVDLIESLLQAPGQHLSKVRLATTYTDTNYSALL